MVIFLCAEIGWSPVPTAAGAIDFEALDLIGEELEEEEVVVGGWREEDEEGAMRLGDPFEALTWACRLLLATMSCDTWITSS